MKPKDFYKLYAALLLTHLGVLYVNEHQVLMLITKYSLVGSLLAWYLTWTTQNKARDPFLFGLVFSFAGDIFLSFGVKEPYFLAGLGCFFLAHLFYIRTFANKEVRQPGPTWLVALLALFSTTLMIIVLYFYIPGAPGLEVPLIFYGVAIMLMWNSTNFISGNANAWPLMVGAPAFVLSDLLLGYNRFYSPIAHADLWIMATYGLGQGLLVYGMHKIHYGSTS